MRYTLKKILSYSAIGLVLGIIVFYTYYQSRAIIAGPQIDIIEPMSGLTSTTSLILVRGVATHAKELTLQGRQILIDLDGRFAEYLLLAEGYNIIELTARDAQGKHVKKTIELVYHTPSSSINT